MWEPITLANFNLNTNASFFNSLSYVDNGNFLTTAVNNSISSFINSISSYLENIGKRDSFSIQSWTINANSNNLYIRVYVGSTFNFKFNVFTNDGFIANSKGTLYFRQFYLDYPLKPSVSEPGGELEIIKDFEPPTPLQPTKLEDLSFYEQLSKTHELFSLDGISDEEWQYLKAMQDKHDLETTNLLLKQSNDDFIQANNNGVYDNVFVSYRDDDPETVAFYNANSLDPLKDYNINLRDMGLGYYDDIVGSWVNIDGTYTKYNSNGQKTIDLKDSEAFLSSKQLLIGATVAGATVSAGLGNPVPLIQLTAIGVGEYLKNRYLKDEPFTEDLEQVIKVKKALPVIENSYDYADRLLKGFTNTGIRDVDFGNSEVQNEAKIKNIGTIAPNLDGAVKVEDVTKVNDSPTISEPSEPSELDNNWLTLIGLLITYVTHKISMSADEIKEMENKLLSHTYEYGENGIRKIEKIVADWKDLEYKTEVTDNDVVTTKIDRDIKAWQGLHSSNLDTSYTGESDTAGNPINVTKGLIGALTGAGIIEYLREGAMSKSLDNVKAQAMADQIDRNSQDSDNDDDNDDDMRKILKGIKKIIFPTETDFVSQGENFGSDLKDLQVHSSKMEVK